MTVRHSLLLGLLSLSGALVASPRTVVATDTYSWDGDTIRQGEFKAWAVSPEHIRSDYKGRPGYFMPVEQTWQRRNDISSYPVLKDSNGLLQAVYNMGLDEMVNAVEPDTTLRTGKEWAGVWTRDVSYSIILSMAALQPEASMISLLRKVNPEGQIIQDTGSGGAWPVSTDRMIWVVAAWEVYKVTGSRSWLEKVYPIALRSFEKDEANVMSPDGLVKGETSFIDWREQSYPKWMQTVDISQSEAFGTNALYCAALKCLAQMAETLGHKKVAALYNEKAEALAAAIDRKFWLDDKGHHAMFSYGYDNRLLNPRSETLGEAIAVLYDVTPAEKVAVVSRSMPQTPWGAPVFFPQISDMPSYHNNALWPFVASYWAIAQAKAGNEQGFLEGLGSVIRPAALFATNKENLNVDNGDYFTELNSSNMLWSLSGNLALTQRVLFGIEFEKDGLRISPFVPEVLADTRTLSNFPYRGACLNITVEGYGDRVEQLTLNGKKLDPSVVIPASALRRGGDIVVKMNSRPIAPMEVNHTPNVKAPLTPTVWLEVDPTVAGNVATAQTSLNPLLLSWQPIEYIGEYVVYKNGEEAGRTRQTSWPASEEAVWQVVGVSSDGVPSFASRPVSTRREIHTQLPGEKAAGEAAVPNASSSSSFSLSSSEVSYQPAEKIGGYRGAGYVEIDHQHPRVETEVKVPEAGEYDIVIRYANGNGPVNTENKCAVRTLLVNGEKAGTVVLPQRGVANWSDWGLTNSIRVRLENGVNAIALLLAPENENMNLTTNHALIDEIIVTPAK